MAGAAGGEAGGGGQRQYERPGVFHAILATLQLMPRVCSIDQQGRGG